MLTRGGAKGTRTPNPLLAKQVRYQLRHGPGGRGPIPPKAARPTHDGTSSRLAGTTAGNFTPDEMSRAISRSVARSGLAWSEVFSETANKFSKSPPSGGEERSSTPSASRKFPLGGDSAKDHTGSPSGRTPTYSVGHVVPARGHRLRAAATLHASSAAAARPPPGAARGLRR